MAHMPTYGEGGGGACADGSCASSRIVTYTATGAEGVDFFVPIGATLAADTYDVGFFGAEGAAYIPGVWDFPNDAVDDRTTSQFRVLIPDVLQAGDVFKFQIIEA